MSERKFEGILEYLCGDIAFKSERNEVREELYDHLMSIYETNLACGMTEDEAEENAVDHLGDTLALKKDLNTVHQKNPLQRLVNVFTFASLFPYMVIVLILISPDFFSERGLFLILAVLFGVIVWTAVNIRKISRSFHVLSSALLIYTLTASAYQLFTPDLYGVSDILLLILFAESLFICYAFHFATHSFLKSRNLRIKSRLRMPYSMFFTTVMTVICYLVNVYFYSPHFDNSHINSYFIFFTPVLATQYLYMNPVGDILINSGIKIDFETSFFKKAIASALAVLIFLSAGLIYEYLYFNRPNNQVITGLALNYDSEERKAIESILSEYKVSAEELALLPDSEISEYKELVPPEKNSLINDYFNVKAYKTISFYDSKYKPKDGYYPIIRLHSYEYAFPLRKEGNDVLYRVLRITDYSMPDEDFKHFSDSIAGSFDYSSWSRHSTLRGSNITVYPASEIIMLADDESGEITYREPLKKIKGLDGETTGCEFRIKRKTYLIYAVNVLVKDGLGNNIGSSVDYVFKKKPITLKYRSAWGISGKHGVKDDISNNSISATSVFYTHEKTHQEYVEYLKEKYNS